LKGDKIPLTAQILQITDIYDALITDRPYRQALCHKEAIATMRAEAGRGWWNSSVIDELEALLCWQAPSIEAIQVAHAF
jgi:putative two-component system response regulator